MAARGSEKPSVRAAVWLITTVGMASVIGSVSTPSSPRSRWKVRPARGLTPNSSKKPNSTGPSAKVVLRPPPSWTPCSDRPPGMLRAL
jgi:hypothetical protein